MTTYSFDRQASFGGACPITTDPWSFLWNHAKKTVFIFDTIDYAGYVDNSDSFWSVLSYHFDLIFT